MSSLQETMKKVTANEKLNAQFMEAIQFGEDNTITFLHSLGCHVTKNELLQSLREVAQSRELSPEELAFVSGGSKEGADAFFKGIGDVIEGIRELNS